MTKALTRRTLHPQVLGRGGRRAVNLLELLQAALRPPEPPKFLTLQQAAEYTGLSVAFLRRLIERQKLSALRDGATDKVRRADLDNLPDVAELAECGKKLAAATSNLRTHIAARRRS
jgi:excisionase family DNA binding protein